MLGQVGEEITDSLRCEDNRPAHGDSLSIGFNRSSIKWL